MPGKSIMSRITDGNMTIGAVAKVLGIQKSKVVTLTNRHVLKYTERKELVKSLSKSISESNASGEKLIDMFAGRQVYHTKRVYDIDSIGNCAIILLCKEGRPITKDLHKLIAMHGSDEMRRKLHGVSATVKVKKIMLAVSTGEITAVSGMRLYAASSTPDAREHTKRGKMLEVMYENDDDSAIQKAMQEKGVSADFLVMRTDQKPLKAGAMTFTFTSEMKCFADILGISSYILANENKEAGELLLAIALRNGFDLKEDEWLLETDLSRKLDELEKADKKHSKANAETGRIKSPSEAATAIRAQPRTQPSNTKTAAT